MLLCEKHFVELVNGVSGTKLKPQSSHAHFLQKLALFSPPQSLGYCTFSDTIKAFTYMIFFQSLCSLSAWRHNWRCRLCNEIQTLEYLWSFLEMLCSLHWAPSCGRKPPAVPLLSHSEVAWTSLLCCTVLAHLSWIPTSDCFSGFLTPEVFQHCREKLMSEGVLQKQNVSFQACSGGTLSLRDWVTTRPVSVHCGITVWPSSLGMASSLGLHPLRGWRCRQGNTPHVQIPEPETTWWCRIWSSGTETGKEKASKPGLIKNTKKQPIFSPPNSSPLMFTVIKKHGWEM